MKHAVRVIPRLLGPAANERVLDGYRASLLIRACDDHDTGYLPEDQVIDSLCSLGKHRKTAESLIRKAVNHGFVKRKIRYRDRRRMLKIVGYDELMREFKIKEGCKLIEVPTELIAGRAWLRGLATVACTHAATTPDSKHQPPVARITIAKNYGISPQTQRRAEKIAEIKRVPHWDVEPLQPGQRTDLPGTKTDGKYLYTRLANTYWRTKQSPIRVTSRRVKADDSCHTLGREHHRRRTVARDRVEKLKPKDRVWSSEHKRDVRGGNTRIYYLAIKHNIILSSSSEYPPDFWEEQGCTVWPRGKTRGRSWDSE